MYKQSLNKILWGASTSAYQVEGAALEHGKGPSIQDMRKVPETTSDFSVASDHYHRFEEDLLLFREMGMQSYRFSISWSRIFPEGEGKINQEGVDFYHKLIDRLREYEIEPIVTCFHFDLPYSLQLKGGWGNRDTIDAYFEYCKFLFEAYGTKVKYWLTINEQNMLTMASRVLSGTSKSLKDVYQENHHMFVAQAKVIDYYHNSNFDGLIGVAPNITSVYPQTSKPSDFMASQNLAAFRNWLYIDISAYGIYNHQMKYLLESLDAFPEVSTADYEILKKGKCDFIAINYYNTMTATECEADQSLIQGDQQKGHTIPGFFKNANNKNLKTTEFGWEIDSLGFRNTLHEVYSRYNLPIMITENGLGANDTVTKDGKIHDIYRIEYLESHIHELLKAQAEGVEIISYNMWSAIDLISTHEGVRKRYGLIYVDRDDFDLRTLNRIPKDSFYWYKEFIKNYSGK